jgi:hypothetical protein
MTLRTTTMKQRAGIGLCGGMRLWAGVASAEERCRQIEYAELKDMSTTALRHVYCDDMYTSLELMRAQLQAAKEGAWRASAQFKGEAQECSDMADKIRTALETRGMTGRSYPCDFSKELEEGQR